jgi:hypothetical protein
MDSIGTTPVVAFILNRLFGVKNITNACLAPTAATGASKTAVF